MKTLFYVLLLIVTGTLSGQQKYVDYMQPVLKKYASTYKEYKQYLVDFRTYINIPGDNLINRKKALMIADSIHYLDKYNDNIYRDNMRNSMLSGFQATPFYTIKPEHLSNANYLNRLVKHYKVRRIQLTNEQERNIESFISYYDKLYRYNEYAKKNQFGIEQGYNKNIYLGGNATGTIVYNISSKPYQRKESELYEDELDILYKSSDILNNFKVNIGIIEYMPIDQLITENTYFIETEIDRILFNYPTGVSLESIIKLNDYAK